MLDVSMKRCTQDKTSAVKGGLNHESGEKGVKIRMGKAEKKNFRLC